MVIVYVSLGRFNLNEACRKTIIYIIGQPNSLINLTIIKTYFNVIIKIYHL